MPIYACYALCTSFCRQSPLPLPKRGCSGVNPFSYVSHNTQQQQHSLLLEDIEQRCEEMDYHPKITVIDPYYDDYDYVEACCEKIMQSLEGKETKEYDLLLSAHGLPMSIIKDGDPYQNQVEGNASAIRTYLAMKGVEFHDIKLVYQSKVGSSAWLEPNLIDVLRNPTHRKVLIYPLAFTLDNSETVFELEIEHREVADKLKYEEYLVAECMNASEKFVQLIVDRVHAVTV